jgi:hypothetical protein
MHLRMTGIALAVALLPVAVGAQTPAPPAAPEAAKSYVPGLEQFMGVIQNEHAKLWYAGQAGNWELAAYQLSEIKEVMSDVQDLVPTFKNLPLAQMIDAVVTGPISDLEKILDAKNARQFSAAYGKLTEACNSCHQAAGVGFIRIRQPVGSAFPNQDFAPKK